MPSYEAEFYKTYHILIFRAPTPKDFVVYKTVRAKTRREVEGHIWGANGAAECVDAPYNPIRLYRVAKGKRKLIWAQGWDAVCGGPVVNV